MKQLFEKVRHLGFAVLFTVVGSIAVLYYPIPLSRPNVSIEVLYVRYACGECYVQHRILKASDSSGEGPLIEGTDRDFHNETDSPIRFIGWDILVFYKGDDEVISRYLDTHLHQNGSCRAPTFKLTGQLKRKLIYALLYNGDMYDGTYFDANSGIALNDNTDPACKDRPEDAMLS